MADRALSIRLPRGAGISEVVCYGATSGAGRSGPDRRNEGQSTMTDVIGRRNLESKIRRILFVEPQSGYSTGFNDTVRVESLGVEYLAGTVRDVAVCELADLRTPNGDLAAHIERFQPDLIALKCGYTTDVPVVQQLARDVKHIEPTLPIIVGGHH